MPLNLDGFDAIPDRLRQISPERIGYLTLEDRTDRRAEESLGRFNWPAGQAEEGEEEAVEEEAAPFFRPEGGDPVEVALAWIRRRALDNYAPPRCRYRVRVYGPKGHEKIDSFQFLVSGDEQEEVEEDTLNPDPPAWPALPRLSFEDAAERASVNALDKLGRSYQSFAQLVLTAMAHLQKTAGASQEQLHLQLLDARKLNDRLIAAIVEVQAEMMQVERRGMETQKAQAQLQLGAQALRTFDDATRLYLMTRQGLPPELQPVLGAVSRSPEMMRALSDPRVQQILQDPQRSAEIATLLQMVVVQAVSQAGPSSPPPPAQAAG